MKDITRLQAIKHMRKIFPDSYVCVQEVTNYFTHSNTTKLERMVYTERLGNMWSKFCTTYTEAIQDILRKKEEYEKQILQEND